MCYNIAIKFRCCIKCGCNILRYIFADNLVDAEMSNSILNQYDLYCIRCDMNKYRCISYEAPRVSPKRALRAPRKSSSKRDHNLGGFFGDANSEANICTVFVGFY